MSCIATKSKYIYKYIRVRTQSVGSTRYDVSGADGVNAISCSAIQYDTRAWMLQEPVDANNVNTDFVAYCPLDRQDASEGVIVKTCVQRFVSLSVT